MDSLPPVEISALRERLDEDMRWLRTARAAIDPDFPWYPYDILGNVVHLDSLLHGANRDLSALAGGAPVADIGGADGDLAFVLERAGGWEVDLVDNPPTNHNGLRGARALRGQLGSRVGIEEVDLDRHFRLPRERYGLVLLLGILYHLQNPFLVLRSIAERSRHCLLSTRVARVAGPERTPIEHLPVGYLVAPDETNGDPTNYWMFSPAGLRRLVDRAGWEILEQTSVGCQEGSDPSSPDRDERAFMLLRSRLV